jgi:signal transduction histidine kinase
LDFAKIEAGRMDWSITELDPKSLVESAAASVMAMFEEKRVDLILALPPQAPPVNADADRLTQVVVNLLSNAHKFAPENTGRVRVGLDVGTTELTISVVDNGPGIPSVQHEDIFEEFHQGFCEDGSHPPGTGLGLAICQRIVDRLGGRIWVESTSGHGATFRFTLPVGGDALLSDSEH